jgi:orotidine-5'-phosphate decarboxylase
VVNQFWPFSNILRSAPLRERLIVSLEAASPREALELAKRLNGRVGMFGVGRHLFVKGGAELIRELRHRGNEIFLDLKFHDEPRALYKAAVEATRLGVKMFDLHPHCSSEVMEKVRTEVTRVCRNEGLRRPYILAVAIMTVLSRAGQARGESNGSSHDQVCWHARQAADASLDGVLTSVAQTAAVRATCGRRFTIVTSGINLAPGGMLDPGSPGPAQAVRAGADYLIVGGALWEAPDLGRTLGFLAEEMERGLRSSPRNPLEFFSDRPH